MREIFDALNQLLKLLPGNPSIRAELNAGDLTLYVDWPDDTHCSVRVSCRDLTTKPAESLTAQFVAYIQRTYQNQPREDTEQ